MARKILKKPKLPGNAFEDCLNAVQNFARGKKQWRRLLEKAYDRLGVAKRGTVRPAMFVFIAGVGGDDAAALRYAPKRITCQSNLGDLISIWEIWLRLRHMDKLAAAVPVMSDAILTARYIGMKSILANAYARYWELLAEIERQREELRLVDNIREQMAAEAESETSQLLLKGVCSIKPSR